MGSLNEPGSTLSETTMHRNTIEKKTYNTTTETREAVPSNCSGTRVSGLSGRGVGSSGRWSREIPVRAFLGYYGDPRNRG